MSALVLRVVPDAHRDILARIRHRPIFSLILVFPLLLLMALFFAWPLLDILLRSLSRNGTASYTAPEMTLHNYHHIFADATLRHVMWRTAEIGLWTTLATTVLAFPTAYLLSRLSRRSATILLALILIPFWVSVVVRLFALTVALGHEGFINDIMRHLGVGPVPLLFNTTSTVIGMVNYLLPYMILILYAGMTGIDDELMSAAASLGASRRQSFTWVYLPLVKAALLSGVLLVFVLSLGFFLTPAILGGAQGTTVAVYIQQEITSYQWGAASAVGMVLLVVTVIGYAAAFLIAGPKQLRATGAPSKGHVGREPMRFSLSSAVLWFFAGCTALVLVGPLIVVIATSVGTSQFITFPPSGFTLHWYGQIFVDSTWTSAIIKSVVVGLGTAALSTLLGLALARVVTRMESRVFRALVNALAYSPLVVPIILLAIGNFDIQVRLGLIGTTGGLILIHTVIAFPLAFAILSSALGGLDQALEEAAWTLGASRVRTFWQVVIRGVMLSVAGAFAIGFITSWDEIIVALFQTGFNKTLPVTIFSYFQSGFQPTVPAVATVMIGFVLAGLAISWVVRRRLGAAQTLRSVKFEGGIVGEL